MAATIASAAQSITSSCAPAMRRALVIAVAILLIALAPLAPPAYAVDVSSAMHPWVVQELKGAAFSRPRDADDSQWRALQPGAAIDPGSAVRTDGSGRVELTNGVDTIRLSPSSEIELPTALNGDPVTRVIHWVGTAFFHVGKRPGPQFEVDTPYIVAIVKGTKFTTTVSDAGASVKVSEGVVGVSAAAGGSSIDVTAGSSASVSAAHSDTVTPGGPSGDATPASVHGKESTLVASGSDPHADAGVDAGDGLSGGADDESTGGSTARVGHGGSNHRGGNGHGPGRDDDAQDVIGTQLRNGGGQGGVDNGDGQNGGGCHHNGNGHHHGDHHHDDHGHHYGRDH
jgi:FecR-like protein